jgi:hypothetical protein
LREGSTAEAEVYSARQGDLLIFIEGTGQYLTAVATIDVAHSPTRFLVARIVLHSWP